MRWQATQIAPTLGRVARTVIRVLRVDIVKQQAKAIEAIKATTGDTARVQGLKINAKWQRELLAFDPVPHLAQIAVPVLAITGGKDLQVDPDDLEVIAATVTGPVETRRPENLTHVLRAEAGAPSIAAYKKLAKRPTDADLLEHVVGWIGTRARDVAAGAEDDDQPGTWVPRARSLA